MTDNSEKLATLFNPWELTATLGAAVMEGAWVVLLYQAMGPATASDPTWMPFVFFLTVMGVAGVAAREMNRMRMTKGFERGALAGIFVGAYLAGANLLLQQAAAPALDPFASSLSGLGELTGLIPGEFWLVLALLWVVYRGYVFGRQGVGRFAVFNFFRLGIVMFFVYGLLSLVGGQDLSGMGMAGISGFSIFLCATLMALTAARVSFLGRVRGGRRNPFTREWVGSISGAVLATVGTGLTIALLVIGRLQALILFVVGIFVTLSFAPLLFLLGLFMDVPIPEMEAVPPPEGMVQEPTGFGPDLLEQADQQVRALPDNMRGTVYLVGIVLSVVLFLVALWVITKTVQRMVKNPDVEYIAKRGDLVELLRREAGQQLRQPRDWLAGRLQGRQRVQAAARIRQIYADLLDLCAGLDIPRPDSQTPLEFLRTVQGELPAVRAELGTITNAYLKVRYGELPETREEVLAVETAWEQVRRAGEAHQPLVRARQRDTSAEKKSSARGLA
ncbi:MAG: DUF4129 domain-containing protein [Anaerolineales bacterium]|nr:DUF4129 domain-containing protein [Anaerolineales bacterium]